ncbi:MAG TPA: hypothetical protein VIU12_08405 [Chryseolinea sp.]
MTSQDKFLKDTWGKWVRTSSKITHVIGELENEVERMRTKKLPETLIDQKDSLIDMIVDFYNLSDQLISAYRIAMINSQAEIMIMNDCLRTAIQSDLRDRIFARLTSDLNEMEERKLLKQQLIDKMNGQNHTE